MATGDPSFGERLRSRRTKLGLTLGQVAERSELSLPYISNLERGRGNPTAAALRALADALETDVGTLLGSQGQDGGNPEDLILANLPRSLTSFSRSERFKAAIERMANDADGDVAEIRQRVLISMASAPRRSQGEPSEDDWRRLLDVYQTILRD